MRDLDALSNAELADLAVSVMATDPEHDLDESWAVVSALRQRGSQDVFDQARAWCGSSDPGLRRLGANVLGQLGVASERPFAGTSTPLLEDLLDDADESVVSCALVALGHLGTGDTVRICSLASSPSDRVRCNVAWCLGLRDGLLALATLIGLSRDVDAEVRDWATFAIARQYDVDSQDVRQALIDRLDDTDAEARGEAMLGLAKRGDTRADAAVAEAMQQPDVSPQVREAADLIARGRSDWGDQ